MLKQHYKATILQNAMKAKSNMMKTSKKGKSVTGFAPNIGHKEVSK